MAEPDPWLADLMRRSMPEVTDAGFTAAVDKRIARRHALQSVLPALLMLAGLWLALPAMAGFLSQMGDQMAVLLTRLDQMDGGHLDPARVAVLTGLTAGLVASGLVWLIES